MTILNKEIDKKKKKEKKSKASNLSGNLKSRDEKDELIQRLKICQYNDNIFDYIDKKYKKYIIKNKNYSNENILIDKEKNDDKYIHNSDDNNTHNNDDKYVYNNDDNCSKNLVSSSFIFFESINSYELKKYKSSSLIFNMLHSITKINMKKLYDENNFLNKGWSDKEKFKELKSNRSKLILGFLKKEEANEYIDSHNLSENKTDDDTFSTTKENFKKHFVDIIKTDDKKEIEEFLKTNPLVCFINYRFTSDYYPYEKNIVCYLYEIQIIKEYIKIGIGTHLINILEQLCKNIHINKILCTVLKSNQKAVMFYKKKCSFQLDESSPENFYSENVMSQKCEYEILKKDILL
ncbi:acetyltransferase, GNAT family, putative [Plasmodium sp. gorilla clade G2]|uniref:acetyltransferase, GNAT family, putative n=1 Tax=Plasmodium sp. gorilla clade G2 TaxID=880535 RepID=UPI000D20CA89|nr:acetyltransferase, GNAT family, putative [Plasmodium sp. gorilla clade G2]SOV17735.1 acetyltransferase, GNAT family, putative [Plasmodium sp. gorilla clade G2]